MKDSISLAISLDLLVGFIGLIIVAAFAILTFGPIARSWVENRADYDRHVMIDSCAKIATVSYLTNDKATVTQPDEVWYQRCLKDKNIIK